jgi:DNA repair protein RadD
MLRPHQSKAIEMLRHSIKKGNRKMILAAPCSFGKTKVSTEILKSVVANGKRGIFICDRIKLVNQAL